MRPLRHPALLAFVPDARMRLLIRAAVQLGLPCRFSVGLLAAAVGALAHAFLLSSLGDGAAFLAFFPAVILAGLFAGGTGGITALAVSLILAFHWIHGGAVSPAESTALLVFAGTSLGISWLCTLLHRALRLLQSELEKRSGLETATREQNQHLAALARQWQTTFDATRDAIWLLDRDCRIVQSNRTAQTLFHRRSDEMRGHRCWEIAHGSDQPIDRCPLTKSRTSLQRETLETRLGDRWFEIVADPILDEHGGFDGAVHTLTDITARHEAEAGLRREQALSEQLINAQLDTVALFDPRTNCMLRWNRHLAQITGYSDPEIAALPAPAAYHDPQELAGADSALAELAATGTTKVELDLVTKDGRRIPFEFIATTVPSADGPLVLSVGRDLTERRQLESTLRTAETNYRLIAENTADIVWLFDLATMRFVYVSPSVLAVRGYTPQEALAQTLDDTLSPESCAFVRDQLHRRLAEFQNDPEAARIRTYMFELRHRDGHLIPAEVVTTLLTGSDGRPERIVGITRDLAERRRAERALRENEQKYRALFDLESDALFLIDSDTGEILEANRAASTLYGHSHDELLKRRNLDLSAEPERTHRAMTEKHTAIPVRQHRRADGTVFPVEIAASHFDWQGRACHLAAIRDITERMRTGEELRTNTARLQALLRIAEQRDETDQQFLDRALGEAIAITGSRYGHIYHYDETAQRFVLNTWSRDVMPACRIADPRTCYALDQTGIWGEAVRQRRPIVLNDFATHHPLKKGYPEGHVALTRFLTIPVFDGDRIIAVVGVANKESDYGDPDILQLQLLMGSVWRTLERRRAEARIREQYALLRGLLEAFDEPVFSLDTQLRYTSFNRHHSEGMRALYGVEIALGSCLLDYQTAEDRAAAEPVLRRVLAGAHLQIDAFSGAGPARRCFEINHSPIRADDGTICGIAVLTRDLTARRAMEDALRESERRFRTVVENADAVIFVLDREGRFELSEGRGLQSLHLRPGELVGRSALELYAHNPEVLAGITDALAGRTSKHLVHEAGIVFNTFYTPRLGPDRQVTGVIGISSDITARVRAEEALRAAKENLEQIVATRTAALAETNRQLSQTSHLARVGGWEIDLASGRNVWSGATRTIHEVGEDFVPTLENALAFYAPESRAEIAAAVDRLREDGTPFERELAFVTAKGRHLWVRAVGEAFRDAGRIVKIGGTFQDITERREATDELRRQRDQLEHLLAELTAANERLREVDRLKSEFLSTMSHELRTPLNSIVGFTGILVKGLAGPLNAEQHKQLGMVQSSARHLLALINDLLDLSRIESGRMVLDPTDFDFAEVVAEVLTTVRPMAEEKELALSSHCTPTTLRLRSDRRRVFQILLNLVNNAVKFTEKGTVAIAAHTEADHLVVAVRDTGIGIGANQMPMLFEAFRQLDGSHRRHYEGTGLGLHLCRKLLGLLGGEIRVASEAAVGSTFTFTLPLAPTPGKPETGERRPESDPQP